MTAAVFLGATVDRTEKEGLGLRGLSRAVYPPEESAEWPGRHLEWAGSQWDIRVVADGGDLVSYTGVLVRSASHDGRPVQIGGIGGVKTHPTARGRGYAAMGMRRAVEFFLNDADVDFALLVCDPSLIEYYSRFGWKEFDGRLQTSQHGETVVFVFNRVMVLDVQAPAPTNGTIDLLGPPW